MNKTYQELCDEVVMLRTGIQQLTTALGNNEWADLLTTDGDLGALESEILRLLEEGQAKDGEISTASQAVETARQAGQRLESQLQESQAMLEEALALGEEASSRCRELEESRPKEIADAVMRARRDWAAQADPEHLRERDARVAAEALREASDEFELHERERQVLKWKAEKIAAGGQLS